MFKFPSLFPTLSFLGLTFPGILRDKTMDDALIKIPILIQVNPYKLKMLVISLNQQIRIYPKFLSQPIKESILFNI